MKYIIIFILTICTKTFALNQSELQNFLTTNIKLTASQKKSLINAIQLGKKNKEEIKKQICFEPKTITHGNDTFIVKKNALCLIFVIKPNQADLVTTQILTQIIQPFITTMINKIIANSFKPILEPEKEVSTLPQKTLQNNQQKMFLQNEPTPVRFTNRELDPEKKVLTLYQKIRQNAQQEMFPDDQYNQQRSINRRKDGNLSKALANPDNSQPNNSKQRSPTVK